ncbi:MOSC domain-containing protein [Priestia koreensis]|uniref:MOSC domain-containing protein n=1 Tax=Priestia koreensis TaxID=284581 RepID=UPI001F56E27B|nr:MOSC domain-containing protein [Priestia koreensis]UNL83266.1 MOSC domain-containing protein [Priestia koreensis]
MTTYDVKSLNIGKIETLTYGTKTFESAIRKGAVIEPIFLSEIGLQGDEQAYKHHGGVEKALCLYPHEHYAHWQPILSNMVETALFGENITTVGLTEENTHIGDTFSYGEAIIQVTEPRNPCAKLATKYDVSDLVLQVRDSGYTGFLFRVLKEGMVSPQDKLVLLRPDPHAVSVALVNDVKFFDKKNKEKLQKVLAVEGLAESLRVTLEKQYQSAL